MPQRARTTELPGRAFQKLSAPAATCDAANGPSPAPAPAAAALPAGAAPAPVSGRDTSSGPSGCTRGALRAHRRRPRASMARPQRE